MAFDEIKYTEPKYTVPKIEAPKIEVPKLSPLRPLRSEISDLRMKIGEEEKRARLFDVPARKYKDKADKFKIWDVLEWARYPITNMLYTAAKEYKDERLEFNDIGKILKSAAYGALLKEKKDTSDVLRVLFPGKKEWVYSVFGMAGDIISDPMTYVTLGLGTGRLALAKVAKLGKAHTLAKNTGKAAAKKFSTDVMKKYGGKSVEEALRNAFVTAAKPGLKAGIPFTSISKKIGTGKLVEAGGKLISKLAVTKPGKLLAEAFVPFGKIGVGARDTLSNIKLTNAHKLSTTIENIKRQIGLIEDLPGAIKLAKMPGPKKGLGAILDGIHKGLKTKGLSKPTGGIIDKTSLYKYIDDALKKMNNFDVQKQIVEELGVKIGSKKPKLGLMRVDAKGLRDWAVDEDVGQFLNKLNKIITDPKDTAKYIKWFTKMQNIWKKMATIYWPGFHMRNAGSNIWIGAFKDGIGLKNLADHKTAITIHTWAKHPDKLVKIFDPKLKKLVSKKAKDAYQEMRRMGVHTGKWARTQLTTDTMGKVIGESNSKILRKIFSKPEKFGTEAGSFFENTARTASYLSDLRKGYSKAESAKRTIKVFLDYENVTEVEQGIKAVIPFYTWFKYNLTNQLTHMITTPGKYSMLTTKALRGIDWAKPEQKKYLDTWMQEGLYIQPFGIKWKGEPLMFNPNLPFQDLGKVEKPFKEIMGAVSPLLKVPFELALGKSFWTGKPIYDLLPVPVPLMFVDKFPPSVKRLLNIQRSEAGVLQMPGKWVHALKQIPQMKLGEGIYGILSPRAQEYQKEKAPFDILARTAGIKVRPIDMQYQKEKYLQDRLKMLKELTERYGK